MLKLTILALLKPFISLENLDDTELSKIDKRTDGDVEVIDVKLNNRKTKKIGGKKDEKSLNTKLNKKLSDNISKTNKKPKNNSLGDASFQI